MKNKFLYTGNIDDGYIQSSYNWWFNKEIDGSYEIFNLDPMYPKRYFSEDHVKKNSILSYVNNVLTKTLPILKRQPKTVLEVGCAGGYFTEQFKKVGIDITACDGTLSGYERTKNRISNIDVYQLDARKEFNLNKKFDIVVCTEVAEHLETPFSSMLVRNLITHSNVVWFSATEPNINQPHYHHPNEQPYKFWINLFDFYGYDYVKLDRKTIVECELRAGFIFFRR